MAEASRVEIELGLTEREARVLMRILWNVGGPPNGARGAADRILLALEAAGVEPAPDPHEGSVSFT